jgi:homogentisate phytyltransferase/homogentisate geranylgeranyltransferase
VCWSRYPLLAAGCILSVRSVIVQIGFFSHIQETLAQPVRWQDCDAITFSVAFILSFSIVIAFFKDLPDIAGDEAAGVRTLAVRIGTQRIFGGCVAALLFDYAAAAAYCLLVKANLLAAAAHIAAGVALQTQSTQVNLRSEVEIKKFYMLIWKCFYFEYLIMLLL